MNGQGRGSAIGGDDQDSRAVAAGEPSSSSSSAAAAVFWQDTSLYTTKGDDNVNLSDLSDD